MGNLVGKVPEVLTLVCVCVCVCVCVKGLPQPFVGNKASPSLQLFSHCVLVTLACYMGEDFTPVAHAALDKYLSAFGAVLAEKYR